MKPFFTRSYLLLSALFFLCNHSYSQCGTAGTADVTISTGSNTIVNSFYPGSANAASGTSSLIVGGRDTRGNSAALANGDMILIIQMQGADINSSNSNSYGDGVNGGNASGYLNSNLVAGRYEYNIVSGFAANTPSAGRNTITLAYPLAYSYYSRAFSTTTGIQTYQVIRVPRYRNLTVNNNRSISAPAWNGSSGGVIVLESSGTINLGGTNAIINANALGFRGGGGKFFEGVDNGSTVTNTDYTWNSPSVTAANKTGAAKGEGIAGTPRYYINNGENTTTTNTVEGYINGSLGRGAPGNAGGGGTDGSPGRNEYNPGGGGGGNGGAGGKGGSGWDGGSANPNTYNTGGYGGAAFAEASLQRLVLGGGGGAGTSNNSQVGGNNYEDLSSGASGGGIVIMRAKSYSGSGLVRANGASAPDVNVDGVTDAAGGGGAGGTIIVVTNEAGGTIAGTIRAQANGGDGGNMETWFAHGPGGGGGGGFVISSVIPNTRITVNGGANGLTRSGSQTGNIDNVYNAAAGAAGRAVIIPGPVGFLNPSDASSQCGVLPITLLSWKGVFNNNKTYLNWQTDAGVNFSHFVVEHSTDGAHFSSLGQVAAAAVSNSLILQYSFVDALPASGINYYRLKMVDKDAQFTYSAIITIRTNVEALQVTVSPNPFINNVVIAVQSKTDEAVQFRVFNSEGKLVWRKTSFVNAGNNAQYFNDLQSLPKGMYILKVTKKETVAEFKLLKQ